MNEKCYEGCCIGRCAMTPPTPLKEIERLREENARLEADNARLEATVATQAKHLKERMYTIEVLRANNAALQSSVDSLAQRVNGQLEENHKREIQKLNANLADANSLIDFQARKLQALEERYAGTKEADTFLRNEIGKFQVRIQDLEMDKSELLSRGRGVVEHLGDEMEARRQLEHELEEERAARQKAEERVLNLETSIRVAVNRLKDTADKA